MIDVFFTIYHSRKLGQNVNGKTNKFCLDQPDNLRNKLNILKGSPRFLAKISKFISVDMHFLEL